MYNSRLTRRQHLIDRLGGGCAYCGYNRCIRALHFHHHDSTHKYEWTRSGRVSLEEVEAHPERFLLLCANCHIEEHDRLDRESQLTATCTYCGSTFRIALHRKLDPQRGKYCSRRCVQRALSQTARSRDTVAKRLWSHVHKTDTCWLWTASVNGSGRGVMGIPHGDSEWRPVAAHHVAWSLTRDLPIRPHPLIPACSERRCVNPDHWKPRQNEGVA